jgi:hypothetical protein
MRHCRRAMAAFVGRQHAHWSQGLLPPIIGEPLDAPTVHSSPTELESVKPRFGDTFDTSIVLDVAETVIEEHGGFLLPEVWMALHSGTFLKHDSARFFHSTFAG